MRTLPANINADDPDMVARSKYVLLQFGTLSENCALMVNGRVAGVSAITVARRKSTRQFLHYQRSERICEYNTFVTAPLAFAIWSCLNRCHDRKADLRGSLSHLFPREGFGEMSISVLIYVCIIYVEMSMYVLIFVKVAVALVES